MQNIKRLVCAFTENVFGKTDFLSYISIVAPEANMDAKRVFVNVLVGGIHLPTNEK